MLTTAWLIFGLLCYTWAGKFWPGPGDDSAVDAARSVIGPVYTTWVNQSLDSRVRATVISMSSQVDAIGQIGGGPLVGVIGTWPRYERQ